MINTYKDPDNDNYICKIANEKYENIPVESDKSNPLWKEEKPRDFFKTNIKTGRAKIKPRKMKIGRH